MSESVEKTPNIALKTTLWIADDLTSEKTQIGWIDGEEGLPALEEAPEQITKKVLDQDTEIAVPGIKKSSQIEVPVIYTERQHKALKEKERRDLYIFEKYPEETAETNGKPLVKYFKGSYVIIDDAKKAEDFIMDKMVIYRTGAVQENAGFPTAE